MATDDRQILVTGTAPAPATWLVPGNGQVKPRSIFAHFNGASAASGFYPAVKVISDAGQTVGIYPCEALVPAGGSADISWFPGADLDTPSGQPVAGVTVEQLFLDSLTGSVTSSGVLIAGQTYLLTVQGTFSVWNEVLDVGTPNANAMFPGAAGGRVSTQVGIDAETIFAYPHDATASIGHSNIFQIDLGSGYTHVEPEGGPFGTPQANYLYRYSVTGQGGTVSFKVADSPLVDNYGKLQIVIQSLAGNSSGGGGGGALVPPGGSTQSVLRTVSGIPTWGAQPDITESDLSLSDNTTANASTAQHGLLRKLDNNAAHFLDGTGAWAPAGTGTIGDITSTGGTITVTAPTGPTTNVDLPTTGVTASSYGDSGHVGQFTVDAEGRLTAASSVSITGGGTVAGADGWVTDTNSYTYASASSFTVGASDLTAVYSPGTRIKLTQTTVKYFVVVSSSFGGGTTTVNVTGGTDYSLANAAITSPFYSYVANPQGYPGWFNFAPATTGCSGTPTDFGKFSVVGRACTIVYDSAGTSNATTKGMTLPIAVGNTDGAIHAIGFVKDGGAAAAAGQLRLPASGTSATMTKSAGAVWANGAWQVDVTATYQI